MNRRQYQVRIEFENTDQVETKEKCFIERLINTAVELLRDRSTLGSVLDLQKGAS